MNLFRKAAISLAATSMIIAPVAASAAPAVEAVRAASVADGQSELEGSSWIYIVLALAAVIGLVVLVSDNDDKPTSP